MNALSPINAVHMCMGQGHPLEYWVPTSCHILHKEWFPLPRSYQLPTPSVAGEAGDLLLYLGILAGSVLYRSRAGRHSWYELMSTVGHGVSRRGHLTACVPIVPPTIFPPSLLLCSLSLGMALSTLPGYESLTDCWPLQLLWWRWREAWV